MRILVFHGYLMRGTGSNIYNAELVERWRGSATKWTCSVRTRTGRPRKG